MNFTLSSDVRFMGLNRTNRKGKSADTAMGAIAKMKVQIQNTPTMTSGKTSTPNPTDTAPQTAADWCNQGQAHCESGDFAAATIAYGKALKFDGPQGNRDCQTWNNHGNALSQIQRYAEALAAYDRSVALNPSYHQAWFNRGQLLTEMGAYGNALESYEKAISIQPEPVYLHAKEDIWMKKKLVQA